VVARLPGIFTRLTGDRHGMKIRLCTAPVYLHSLSPQSIHVDIEHPMLHRILAQGEQTICQGKGEHGIFVRLDGEMTERARDLMGMSLSPWSSEPILLQEVVSRNLNEIADILEFLGEDQYRVKAYRRAADGVAKAPKDLKVLADSGNLRSIPWVGESISTQIEQFISTGVMEQLDALRQRIPAANLLRDPAIDAQTAILLHRKLGITTMEELESSYLDGRLALGVQPISKEDQVVLAIFRRRAGAFSGVLDVLVEGLALIEPLRRRFTATSIAYDLPLDQGTLFRLTPNARAGIRVIFTKPGYLEKAVARGDWLAGLARSAGMNPSKIRSNATRPSLLIEERRQAWEFARAMEKTLRVD
jgi:hypothetical protein